MKCEKCLYRKNCQFLAKHKTAVVEGCTAFESKADLKRETAKEIFEEIENITFSFGYGVRHDRTVARTRSIDDDRLSEFKQKYEVAEND